MSDQQQGKSQPPAKLEAWGEAAQSGILQERKGPRSVGQQTYRPVSHLDTANSTPRNCQTLRVPRQSRRFTSD